MVVTAGVGWAQREGGGIEEIRPGDVVCFAPNEKHWHSASPTTAMTHIAIQEALEGKVVDWLEKVSDEQYRKRPGFEVRTFLCRIWPYVIGGSENSYVRVMAARAATEIELSQGLT